MKKLNYLLIFCLGLILFSCSKDELVNPDNALQTEYDVEYKKGKSKKKKWKHISGNIQYAVAGPSSCSCSPAISGPMFSGGGNMKHLGNVTADVTSCIAPVPNSQDLNVVSSCASLVAPNGDELFITIDPYTLNFNPTDNSYAGITKIKVNGGTGKYCGAKGKFNVSLSQDASFNVSSVWNGVIRY